MEQEEKEDHPEAKEKKVLMAQLEMVEWTVQVARVVR